LIGEEKGREREKQGEGRVAPVGEYGLSSGGGDGSGEGQGGELGLGRPGTSFFPL